MVPLQTGENDIIGNSFEGENFQLKGKFSLKYFVGGGCKRIPSNGIYCLYIPVLIGLPANGLLLCQESEGPGV